MVEKNFDIVGIGNAIVDVIADVEDQYFKRPPTKKRTNVFS